MPTDDAGRPQSVKLTENHARVIRSAVRAATRYFGIPIGKLDGGASWVGAAMRDGSLMTASTAERLFRLVQQPEIDLIGAKRPQGPSLAETQRVIDSHTMDPEGCPLEATPTLEYINLIFSATRTVELYARAFPGSVLFVLPGSAQAVAEGLADEMIDDGVVGAMGRSRRRKLTNFLSFYFGLAERPLQTEEGQSIIGTLNRLGITHNRDIAAHINEALPNQHLNDPEPNLQALLAAETRRNEVLSENAESKVVRKKRRVTMPRIRDSKIL